MDESPSPPFLLLQVVKHIRRSQKRSSPSVHFGKPCKRHRSLLQVRMIIQLVCLMTCVGCNCVHMVPGAGSVLRVGQASSLKEGHILRSDRTPCSESGGANLSTICWKQSSVFLLSSGEDCDGLVQHCTQSGM